VIKVLHCNCGFETRAAHEQGLVAEVRHHASEAHGMTLTYEEALLLAFRAELDETPAPTIPSRGDSIDPKEET